MYKKHITEEGCIQRTENPPIRQNVGATRHKAVVKKASNRGSSPSGARQVKSCTTKIILLPLFTAQQPYRDAITLITGGRKIPNTAQGGWALSSRQDLSAMLLNWTSINCNIITMYFGNWQDRTFSRKKKHEALSSISLSFNVNTLQWWREGVSCNHHGELEAFI